MNGRINCAHFFVNYCYVHVDLAMKDKQNNPTGIFDSGVGGLSVLQSIRAVLPNESLVYLADQAHVPYGGRSLQQVRAFSEEITRFLLEELGAKMIVVACNTASAAALHHLRAVFPDTPFVGMEPAVKPAAENTLSGVVGVLATPATFQGELYASVVERFGQGVTILQDTCAGLVAEIEAGRIDGEQSRNILKSALTPMMAQNLDTVVLGCTHYPFVIPLIQEIVGPEVHVIDPAPAIARQTAKLLDENDLRSEQSGSTEPHYLTSGNTATMAVFIKETLDDSVIVSQVEWTDEAKLKLSE